MIFSLWRRRKWKSRWVLPSGAQGAATKLANVGKAILAKAEFRTLARWILTGRSHRSTDGGHSGVLTASTLWRHRLVFLRTCR
ncbi:hypothetical protein PoB_006094600 [Plakobranchus ocellatus]|uniref:Uncharacterized protein n=1 Tax=Plakobranchus ocellatus TaxID=259542 RepID=A0AAV4CRM2_9GAST|nr:hypothetical protein PoB_006094600 [Plakobranchus ocellatus]